MSIVLEALEKAQKEGKVISPVRIERVPEEVKKPRLKVRSRSNKNFIYLLTIPLILIIFLGYLGWWVNQNNSSIPINSVKTTSPEINTSGVSKIPAFRNILPKRRSPFNVTGVVWDEKEPIVLVNGKFLKKGDSILGAKIIDIQLHEVKFLRKNREFAVSVE